MSSAALTLILRMLPPLPADPTPGATWSVTWTRAALASLLGLPPYPDSPAPPAAPLVDPTTFPPAVLDACQRYLNEASDQQLEWVASQILDVARALDAARVADAGAVTTPPTGVA